jgi:hypothetical protein
MHATLGVVSTSTILAGKVFRKTGDEAALTEALASPEESSSEV